MIETHQRTEAGGIFRFPGDSNTTTEMMAVEATDCYAHPDPLVTTTTMSSKRKSFAMSESPPPPPPPTEGVRPKAFTFASPAPVGVATGGGGGGGEANKRKDRNASSSSNRVEQLNDIQVSCCVGETMRIPLSGKTVSFRVVKRRGRGFSSVVFECQREKEEQAGADGPTVVTVKVSTERVLNGGPTASGVVGGRGKGKLQMLRAGCVAHLNEC